jgi:hypothetical protein
LAFEHVGRWRPRFEDQEHIMRTPILIAIAVAGLVPAAAALAHEDAAIPESWAPTRGNSVLALDAVQESATSKKAPHHHRPVDKCDTMQGELYLKCRA